MGPVLKPFSLWLGIIGLGLLLGACLPTTDQSQQTGVTVQATAVPSLTLPPVMTPKAGEPTAVSPSPESTPLLTDYPGPSPTFTSTAVISPTTVVIILTVEPSPTSPPPPTPVPTPVATAVAAVPLEFWDATPQPFWFYYWLGNEIWRVDDQGQEAELLLDTEKALGQLLTAIHDHARNSDGYYIGPRLVVSPDKQKLALVTLNSVAPEGEFSIFIFDVNTKAIDPVGKGLFPTWSPTGEKIAFVQNYTIMVFDLATKATDEVVTLDDTDRHVTDLLWSADGQQLIYTVAQGYAQFPIIWSVDAQTGAEPKKLFEQLSPTYRVKASPDNEHLFFLSAENSLDGSEYNLVLNLWSFSLATGKAEPLTFGMYIDIYALSPDGAWLFCSGYHTYEPGRASYDRDIWLLSADGQNLYRLTEKHGNIAALGWSPDGAAPIGWSWRQYNVSIVSPQDLALRVLSFDQETGMAIGGVK